MLIQYAVPQLPSLNDITSQLESIVREVKR